VPLDADRNDVLVSSRTEQALRFGFAAALVAALFAVRWDPSLDHFDFRAWRGAASLLDEGANPYDSSLLNAAMNPLPGDASLEPSGKDLHLFNPPTWITELRLLNVSALVMSLSGAIALFASLVVLAKDSARQEVAAYLIGAFMFLDLTPSVSTFRLGQTGLLLAGLIGLRLLAVGTRVGGVPVALLSFKPHLALASGIAELLDRPRRLLLSIATAIGALVGLQLIQDGVDPWFWWADVLREEQSFGTLTDMSIRTLSPYLPWSGPIGFLWLGIGLGAATIVARVWRLADARLLILASLATIAYFSGHAFSHDWLWLPLVPVVCRWRPITTLSTAFGFSVVHTLAFDMRIDDVPLQPKSLLGLATVIFLADATRRSAGRVGAATILTLSTNGPAEPREALEAA
jgi:hypothetical protein